MAIAGIPSTFRSDKETFRAQITGAQAGTVTIPITNSKTKSYSGAIVADTGIDITRFFTDFVFHSVAEAGKNAKTITVQVNLAGSTAGWVNVPAAWMSNAAATVGSGEIVSLAIPISGVAVRLVSAQPDADTECTIHILMGIVVEAGRIRRT